MTHTDPTTTVVGMATLDELVTAVEEAQGQLDELAAVDTLWQEVGRLRHRLIREAAANGYPHSEIGRAAGDITKQAVQKIAAAKRVGPRP